MSVKTCYACAEPATSQEHAPPKSFFPEGRRRGLITVPSCEAHNHANAPDVEYIRNSITFLAGINDAGTAMMDKTMRSFDRSPALFDRTFQSARPLMRNGEEVGAFKVDLGRLKAVMISITQALHYRDHGQKWRWWRFFSPTLGSEKTVFLQQLDNWEPFRQLLKNDPCKPRETGEPTVFAYGSHQFEAPYDWAWMYRLTFYEGFTAYTWMLSEEQAFIESGSRQSGN